MYNFIQAIAIKEVGNALTPAQIRKIAKSMFKNGIEPSEESVKSKIREVVS